MKKRSSFLEFKDLDPKQRFLNSGRILGRLDLAVSI